MRWPCLPVSLSTLSVNTDCKPPRGSLSSLLTVPITGQSALFHVLIFCRTLSASHCGKLSPLTSRVFKHIWKSEAWLIYVNHGMLWGARYTTSVVYLTAWFSPEPQWCHHYDVCHCITWAAEQCHRWVSVIIYHRRKKTAHLLNDIPRHISMLLQYLLLVMNYANHSLGFIPIDLLDYCKGNVLM